MTTELAVARSRDLMPTVRERGGDLDHVPEMWGLYPDIIPHDPIRPQPPSPEVLDQMEQELATGLVPLSAWPDAAQATTFAASMATLLSESFPQRDQSGSQYAQRLVERLLECPADLVRRVCTGLIDGSPHKPAPSEVKAAVASAMNKRRLLLLRVQAAQRYWIRTAAEAARRAEIDRDRSVAAAIRQASPSLNAVLSESAGNAEAMAREMANVAAATGRAISAGKPLNMHGNNRDISRGGGQLHAKVPAR